MNINKIISFIALFFVGIAIGYFVAPTTRNLGASYSHTSSILTAGGFTTTGSLKVGYSPSTVDGINFGSCAVVAYATTIAASSTATVDCSSTGRIGGTLTGVTSGDTVMVNTATPISSTLFGVKILGAHASTTAGYITLTLVNETGTTFTWTSGASSTIRYQIMR